MEDYYFYIDKNDHRYDFYYNLNKKSISWCSVYIRENNELEFASLDTDVFYLNKGYATKLVHFVVRYFKDYDTKYNKIYGTCDPERYISFRNLQRFYKKCGFVFNGSDRSYFEMTLNNIDSDDSDDSDEHCDDDQICNIQMIKYDMNKLQY